MLQILARKWDIARYQDFAKFQPYNFYDPQHFNPLRTRKLKEPPSQGLPISPECQTNLSKNFLTTSSIYFPHLYQFWYWYWSNYSKITANFSGAVQEHPQGGGTSMSGGRGGGLDLTSRGKMWDKVQPSSPIKRKNLGSSVITRRKNWGKIPILGQIWNSEGKIWGICHLYFWRKNLGLQQEFQRQILGPSPPRPPNMEVPPWGSTAPLIKLKRPKISCILHALHQICVQQEKPI